MNAPHRLFVIFRPSGRFAGTLAALGLAGCAGNPLATAQVDPASPVAAEVARVGETPGEFPTFQKIPPFPKDQRPLGAWAPAAAKIERAGLDLERQTADNTWTLTATEAYALRAQRRLDAAPSAAESTVGMTEAYAKAQRKRATPPPPPKR